jgi:hypothetical protein
MKLGLSKTPNEKIVNAERKDKYGEPLHNYCGTCGANMVERESVASLLIVWNCSKNRLHDFTIIGPMLPNYDRDTGKKLT